MEEVANAGICPVCGGSVPEETIWLHRQRFYCSEKCVRNVIGRGL